MRFSLIIPTYNEKENIVILINKLLKLFKPFDYEIIVIDDDSPDKTWKTVKDTYKNNKRVKVIRRMNKRGLSSAIMHGFDNAKGEFVGVMDADMQHDMNILPKMINYTKQYDLVVGSRFVKGGGVKNWSWSRIFVSKIAALLAKILLHVKINDSGSGYFIIKKKIYERVKHKLYGKGFKPLLEIYFYSNIKNFKEVPYVFGPRTRGKSKLGMKAVLEYLEMLLRFFFIKYKRFIKFCLVGVSGIIVNMGLLYILTEFIGLFYLISSIIAIETSIITNFILNNIWTWRDRRKKGAFFKRLAQFNLVCVAGLFINFALLYILTSSAGIYYLISNLIGIVGATLWNFFVNNYWTFKK